VLRLPKKNKQQQAMEQQLQSFAGTTAGSVLIAVGLGVVALPYAVKYLVKNAEEQAIPWAYGFGKGFYDEYTGTVGAALKKLEAETWHEANPDITQADIDIPEGVQEYFAKVGLPASSMVVAVGDKEALSVYQHSGEWNLYGTRKINGQHYYIVVPKGIKVYVKIPRTLTEPPDEYGLCRAGWSINEGVCEKETIESFLLTPSVWP
jgi:hypothetical protein